MVIHGDVDEQGRREQQCESRGHGEAALSGTSQKTKCRGGRRTAPKRTDDVLSLSHIPPSPRHSRDDGFMTTRIYKTLRLCWTVPFEAGSSTPLTVSRLLIALEL